MADAKNTATASASVSFPFFSLLGIVFVVLKLNPGGHLTSPVVDWSWWWVTAPFWGPWALLLGFFIVLGLGWLVVTLLDDFLAKRARKARDKARAELRNKR
jgi:hypothetical protein